MQVYRHKESIHLENGGSLQELTIAYHTWGQLNSTGDNVIWICHALTANSDAKDWWPGLIGEGLAFDTNNYFIVCANILGSCYGTTGPVTICEKTGRAPFHQFPVITIRDMVKAHQLLQQHLNIRKIRLLVGGSMGGYQVLEWCILQPELIDRLFLLATSAKESAWGIAVHTTQRMAIETDPTWKEENAEAGSNGLKTARAIGMLTYRNYASFCATQTDEDNNKLDHYKASSYIIYQGNKLVKRFNAYTYWYLTKAMDSHNLARGRQDLASVLSGIKAKTLLIGFNSDILCPVQEQQFMAEHIPGATFIALDSVYGHDGFLVETEAITHHLTTWLKTN